MGRRKKKTHKNTVLFILLLLVIGIVVFFQTRPKLQVVTVVSNIEGYDYYLESNATKVYKKYYEELEEELKSSRVNEKEYAKLISKLFLIDYYTLNNKVTNKDIGGVAFIHSNLKDKFLEEASLSIYKYVKEDLYKTRKQKLPEVKDVDIVSLEETKYKNGDYKDSIAYKVKCSIKYVKNLEYPKDVEMYLIHENNKLSIVEIN